jgi:hypothetical protein
MIDNIDDATGVANAIFVGEDFFRIRIGSGY